MRKKGTAKNKKAAVAATPAESASGSIQAMAEALFKECDKNGSGQVDAQEIADAMNVNPSFKRLVGDGIDMKQVDVNGNGKLSSLEFVHFVTVTVRAKVAAETAKDAQMAAMEKQARAVFDSVDTNKDGSIDGEELAKGLRVNKGLQALVRRDVSMKDIISADLDENRDGKVSFDEFCAFIRAEAEKAEAQTLAAAFEETLEDADLGAFFD